MAIQISRHDESTDDPKLVLTFNNGDLEALNQALEKTRFVNEEALIRYAIVAMLQNEDSRLYLKQNGDIVALQPNSTLIRPEDSPE